MRPARLLLSGRPDVSVNQNQGKRSDTGRMRTSNLLVISGVRQQGKQELASDLYSDVKCFVSESELFILQMWKSRIFRFRKDLENLLEEFQNRFSDFVQSSSEIMFFPDPFSIIVDTTPEYMQLELVELQNSEILKSKHRESVSVEFHGALDISSYFMLGRRAMKLMPLFGSTYICEQSVSGMNPNKSHLRSRILGSNLEKFLRVATTSMEPEAFNKRH